MTEYTYAVLDNQNIVENIIVAKSTGLEKVLKEILPDAANFVLVTENTGPAHIGGDFYNKKFRPASPYPSWTWNDDVEQWESSVSYPTDNKLYEWNEDELEWSPVVPPQPFPSWTWNEENWWWQPPVARTDFESSQIWNEELQQWEDFVPPEESLQ